MKFQFDLLPNDYKSLPRDYLGFILAVAAIIVCLSWTFTVHFRNMKLLYNYQSQIDQADKSYRELNQRVTELQPPAGQIAALKSSIEFINHNLDTPGSSWVDFLYSFESTVPERIYISDINPKDLSIQNVEFTITGEGSTIYDVLDFISRLQKSGRFSRVFLKQNSTRSIENGTLTSFIISFTYNGKS